MTAQAKRPFPRVCAYCGKRYMSGSDRSRYCTNACRQRAYRERPKRARQRTS